MRAGTQTLIQALQALPWTSDPDDPDNDDDIMHNELSPVESESEDEDEAKSDTREYFCCRVAIHI